MAGSIAAALYYALVVVAVILAVVRNRETAAALAWSLAIVFLPVVGILAFFAFGFTKEPRRLRRKRIQLRRFRERHPGVDAPRPPVEARPRAVGWASLGRVAEELTGFPLREGNRVVLHTSGKAAFDAIFEAVERAERHVHVLMYIFRHDRLGKSLLDLLVKKARAGVRVRLLIDAVGSLGAWYSVRRLRRAGGEGAIFGPLHFLNRWFTLNFRNHRKIIVCDGHAGFFGGLNVGDEYLGDAVLDRDWYDAHFEAYGPVVRDLQYLFVEDWDFATGQTLPLEAPGDVAAKGPSTVQLVPGGPHQEIRAIRQLYLDAISRAEERLAIATPYFVPDASLRDAIRSAALRGVEITMLQQGRPPDYWLTYFASQYFAEEILCENVRLFEYRDGMMHAKMVIADGRWAAVGSANFDNRSLRLNFELVGLFEGAAEVQQIEACFREALSRSREVRLDDDERRTWIWRLGMESARLLSPLL